MRLVHTSDWHLGRTWLSVPLLDEQRAFLTWLEHLVHTERVDALLIAGDVYDRALPPADAVALFGDALLRLARICPVIIIPGNHDSATRLGFLGPLLELGGVHVRAALADIDKPIELTDESGDVVRVYGIPYLEPVSARHVLECDPTHEAVLSAAMDQIRGDLASRSPARTVVMSHAFIAGAASSDSERDVAVGGVSAAPVTVFDGVDYVALGHLHRPQTLTTADASIRYSGSPIAYSFSEEGVAKSVTIVDVDATGVRITERAIPTERALKTIRGDIADLLEHPQWEPFTDHWVCAVITDARRPDDPLRRLRARFPHVIELRFEPHHEGVAVTSGERRIDPRVAQPADVCIGFIEHVTGVAAQDDEIRWMRAAVEDAQRVEARV